MISLLLCISISIITVSCAENLVCRKGWEQLGSGKFTYSNDPSSGCYFATTPPNENNGVTWLGSTDGVTPSVTYDNFIAEVTFKSANVNPGGLIFRAKDINGCAQVNGGCDAYWIFVYLEYIGLKGPDPNKNNQYGWLSWEKIGFRLAVDKYYTIRANVNKNKIIISLLDDNGNEKIINTYNGLTVLSNGGIGYRTPGPGRITVKSITVEPIEEDLCDKVEKCSNVNFGDDIKKNKDAINTNAANIATNTGDIAANKGDITKIKNDMTTNTGGIETNKNEIRDNKKKIKKNEKAIADLQNCCQANTSSSILSIFSLDNNALISILLLTNVILICFIVCYFCYSLMGKQRKYQKVVVYSSDDGQNL